LFVYDQEANAIYFHSAAKGRLLANIKANPKVCFTAGEMGRLLPAETAKEFDVEYGSVMVFGEAYWVEDPFEAQSGLELLLARYAPHLETGQDYRAITQDELEVTAVYRMDIQAWSGKENRETADFPGAFAFGESPGD
jgi:nitroimidazol reductase NimA-like FMN-containing flavoprotein (pyridoxamine 5'-phosphate oxidase superfamily)